MYSVATFDSPHVSLRFCWFCYIQATSYNTVNDNYVTLNFTVSGQFEHHSSDLDKGY